MIYKPDVAIIGGGMITIDLLLPVLYHLQRIDVIGEIDICALNASPLIALRDDPSINQAFPGQTFRPYPAFDSVSADEFPELYKEVIASLPPRQIVVVAMPDHLHYDVIMKALEHDQHVLCVKPLVLEYAQDMEIEKLAYEKGLFVGIEYHKRFDRRSLLAKKHYELGDFGEFTIGEAKLIEPYYYRNSNFQNWFTVDRTDPFTYIGCHYVDLVYFITGLKPVEVSVSGIKGSFPNGNIGYMWANGRVRYENGAILSVTNGLGYPDDGAGSNEQCLSMIFEGPDKTGFIKHDDQFRGVTHSYLEGIGSGGSIHNYINPDFFRLVPWEGTGYKPSGYGFDSVSAIVDAVCRIEKSVADKEEDISLVKRREMINEISDKNIIATPSNSYINELVVEAARMSILNDGEFVKIIYDDDPHVEFKYQR